MRDLGAGIYSSPTPHRWLSSTLLCLQYEGSFTWPFSQTIRPKQFQIENDSQKGGTIPGRSCHKPALPMLWFKGMSGKTWPLNPRFLTIPCWGPDGKPMRSGRPAQADYLPLECLGGERCN